MKKVRLLLIASSLVAVAMVATSINFAQRTQPRPQSDLKVTYKVSMQSGGTDMPAAESTSMIKGARQRSEEHRGYLDSINITQCDLKRTLQINEKTQKYIATPMETSDTSTPAAPARPNTSTPSRRGGVVTYITSARDTGERKEMFGFTARHVKTSTRVESSPDACSAMKQRYEQDGWYIDLNVAFSCDTGRPPMIGNPMAPGGCQDRIQFRREGTGKTGFPLIETTTIYDQNDQPSFTTTKEVVDLSRQPLDAALFDIPAGYTEAHNWQELNGQGDAAAMMAQAMGGNHPANEAQQANEMAGPSAQAKAPGAIRIGVVQINNRTSNSVSTDALRQRLISSIQGYNVEAVALNASSQGDADAEAKAKQCDFILLTDIASLKLSTGKALGGMLGRATGVGGLGKTESKLEFKLIAVGENAPRLQATASGKEEGDEASAGIALDAEAKAVSSAAKKKS